MHLKKQQAPGFTIVELLIVIVVIGILAAITIVAYNGVQNKARATTALNAASDAAKKVEVFAADGVGYPATLAAAGVVDGNTTFQYSVNNAVAPATYCLTATNTTASYRVSSTNNAPTAGACPGHGSGGVAAITNLNPNPSAETDGSLWGGFSNAGSSTLSVATNGGFSGPNYMHLSVASGASGGGGIYAYLIPATAGTIYTGSAYARTSSTKTFSLGLEWHSSSAGLGISYGSSASVGSAGWTRLSSTGTAPAGTTSVTLIMYVTGGSGLNSGDTLDIDAGMTTAGPTLYNYADGSSPNWVWNGTVNNSNSTGPPL